MARYDFTLKFNLNNRQADPESYIELLYREGCDDALISMGKPGFIFLHFTREAPSAYEAISSAIATIKAVLPQATLAEATPDLVGLTDVAKLLGCTRQNIRKLVVTNDPGAPQPVYEGTPSIWHLAEILTWLKQAKAYVFDETLLEIAKTNMDANITRNWQKVESNLQDHFRNLVA